MWTWRLCIARALVCKEEARRRETLWKNSQELRQATNPSCLRIQVYADHETEFMQKLRIG